MAVESTYAAQLEQLAVAMAQGNNDCMEQTERTFRAQRGVIQAAEGTIAAQSEMITQLQAQGNQDRASLQNRITVLEQTIAVQQTENAALEALRIQHAKIARLAPLEWQDTCKMERFLGEFRTANKAIACIFYSVYADEIFKDPRPCCNQVPVQMQGLRTLINERFLRPIGSVLDAAVQDADTEKLVLLSSTIMKAMNTHYVVSPTSSRRILRPLLMKPLEEVLDPLIAARQARALAR
jgi:hypothetical protein